MSEANLRATAGDVIAFFDTLPTNASSVSVRIKPNATLGVEELRKSFFLSEWADNVATVGNDSFVDLVRLFGCDAVLQQRDDLKAVGTAAYCGIALFGWIVFCLCGVGCKIDDEPAPAPASQQQAPAPAPHRMRQARMQRQQEPDEPEPAVDHVFDTSESFAVCWRCDKRLPENTLACTNCFAVLPDGVRNNAYTFAGFGVENGSSVDDSSEDKDKNCTICLSQLEAGDEVVSLPCFHRFHTECILAWFKKEDNCAICREGVALAVIKAENLRKKGKRSVRIAGTAPRRSRQKIVSTVSE
jgi:ribosomal protein L40E